MNAKKLFALSLLLNLGLLALVAYLSAHKPGTPAQADQSSTIEPSATVAVKSSPDARLQPATKPFHWGQLESSDYKTYISNLRAVGCPEQTIRDIITADVDSLYTRKLKRLPEREGQKLRREENNVIVSLLGPVPEAERSFAQAGSAGESSASQNDRTQGATAWNQAVQLPANQNWISQSSTVNDRAVQSAVTQGAAAEDSIGNRNSTAQGPAAWNANPLNAASQNAAAQGGTVQNAAPQSSGSQNSPAPQRDVRVPLAFQNINSSGLNDGQQQAINQIQQNFTTAVGGDNADPSTSDYLKRWQNAQRQSDDLIRTTLGQQTFLQDQLRAAQQAANHALGK